MRKKATTPADLRPQSPHRADEIAAINGGFTDYLRGRGFAAITVEQCRRHLLRVSQWLRESRRHRSLDALARRGISRLLRDFIPDRSAETAFNYRKALRHWLRFRGTFSKPGRTGAWEPWVADYVEFLQRHRGVGPATIEHAERSVRAFLSWKFGRGKADWRTVKATDIWRFAERMARGVSRIYAKARLGHLRRFLRFVQLQGACSGDVIAAVPSIAVFGQSPRPAILSDLQSRTLLASFSRTRPEGRRDYAMTVCMLELGLRGAEVIGLRLHDIDWRRHRLKVPATKTGRGRELPLPPRLLLALRRYVHNGRPTTGTDHVFVRHPRRVGQPLSRAAIKSMVRAAYVRCGFPASWFGTHRLRHTFVSRLVRRGADIKPLADLLGHRRFNSTNHYAHVDTEALRPLSQPWPA